MYGVLRGLSIQDSELRVQGEDICCEVFMLCNFWRVVFEPPASSDCHLAHDVANPLRVKKSLSSVAKPQMPTW